MALSFVELLKGESDPVMSGVIENIITADQFTANLPFEPIMGDHVSYVREKALPTTSTPSSAASVSDDDSFEEDRMSSYLRRFIINQSIDNLDARGAGGVQRARSKAIAAASKSLGRKYGTDSISGNSNFTVTVNGWGATGYSAATIVVGPGHDTRMSLGVIRYTHVGTTLKYKAPGDAEFGAAVAVASGVKVYSDNPNKWITVTFSGGAGAANGDITFTISPTATSIQVDGLLRLVTASQTIVPSNNGDAIALATLDQLADLTKDRSGQRVYVMNSRTRRSVAALLRAAGGATISEYRSELNPSGIGESMLTYNGLPILVSDWVPITRTTGGTTGTTGVVFCMSLGSSGVRGLYSEAQAGDEDGGELIARGANGIEVLNLGTAQNTDTKRVRVKAYWGLKLGSDLALAMADGITN